MQPTLAILHTHPPSFPTLMAARAHACSLTVISLTLTSTSTISSRATTFYTINLLPHDSFRILTPPSPLAGVMLVLSTNAVHVLQVISEWLWMCVSVCA